MKTHAAVALASLSAFVVALACDVESAPEPAANIPELLGLGDDWYPVSEGVWARDEDDGAVRHLGIGEAGRRHTVAAMEEVGILVRDAYDADPSPENEAALHGFRLEFERLQQRGDDSIDELLVNLRNCVKAAVVSADVVPVTGGIKATAGANYRNTCDSQTKSVSTYAYTQADYNSKTQTCAPPAGLNVTCSSAVTSLGSTGCYGYADSSGAGLYSTKVGYTCGSTTPPPPPYQPPVDDCPQYPYGVYCQPK